MRYGMPVGATSNYSGQDSYFILKNHVVLRRNVEPPSQTFAEVACRTASSMWHTLRFIYHVSAVIEGVSKIKPAVHAAFDQNQSQLGILVLTVTVEVFAS